MLLPVIATSATTGRSEQRLQVWNAALDPAVAAELLDVAVTGGNGTSLTGTRSCPCKSAGNASTALSKTVLNVTPGLRM